MSKRVYFYKIKNTVNGKGYIGQSVNIAARWKAHLSLSRMIEKSPYPQYIHRAINKHGVDNFQFEIIASSICNNREDSDLEEDILIQQHGTMFDQHGYNVRPGGKTRKGWSHSEETKRKFSEKWHTIFTPEVLARAAASRRGTVCSEERRRKVSAANKGKQFCLGHKQPKHVIEKRKLALRKFHGNPECSIEGCKNLDGYKFMGVRYCRIHIARFKKHGSFDLQPRKPPPNKGIPLSPETKKKLSEALRGRVAHNKKSFSDEEIRKILTDKRGCKKVGKDFIANFKVIERIRRSYFIDPADNSVKEKKK